MNMLVYKTDYLHQASTDLEKATSTVPSLIQSRHDCFLSVQSWESIVERSRRRQPNWRCKTDICWLQ